MFGTSSFARASFASGGSAANAVVLSPGVTWDNGTAWDEDLYWAPVMYAGDTALPSFQLATVDAPDTLSAAIGSLVGFTLDRVDATDTMQATMAAPRQLSLAATDVSDTLFAQAFIGVPPVILSLAALDAGDVLVAGFQSTVATYVTQMDADDRLNAQLSVPGLLHFTLAVTDAPDTLQALVAVDGTRGYELSVRDADDTMSAVVRVGRRHYGAISSCRRRVEPSPHGCGRPPNLQNRC